MRRTMAMRMYVGAYALLYLLLIYFALAWTGLVPRPRPPASAPGPAQAAVICLALLLAAAGLISAARWSSAPQRAWFWPVAAVPPVLFFAPDMAEIVGFLIGPPSLAVFVFALVAAVSLPALVITAAIAAFESRIPATRQGGLT